VILDPISDADIDSDAIEYLNSIPEKNLRNNIFRRQTTKESLIYYLKYRRIDSTITKESSDNKKYIKQREIEKKISKKIKTIK